MSSILSLYIDNQLKFINSFVVPEMSLSSSRSHMIQHTFLIMIKAADLIRHLTPAYLDWVAESQKDDELCGNPKDELAEAGYPDLESLVHNPPLLTLVIGSYLLDQFLNHLTWDGCTLPKYWLDTITDCHLEW